MMSPEQTHPCPQNGLGAGAMTLVFGVFFLPRALQSGWWKYAGGRETGTLERRVPLTRCLLCRLLLLKLQTPKFVWSSSLDPQRPNSRF